MLGVVKLVPVLKDIPPVATAYQLIVPALAVTPKITVPVPHRVPGVFPVIVGTELTVNEYVTTAGEHGEPNGLFVVTVMVTTFPISPRAGVYVKLNGDVLEVLPLVILPKPFSATMIDVALPPKVFPLTVIGDMPHVLPLAALNSTTG